MIRQVSSPNFPNLMLGFLYKAVSPEWTKEILGISDYSSMQECLFDKLNW